MSPGFQVDFDTTGLSIEDIATINNNILAARNAEVDAISALGAIYEETRNLMKYRRNSQGWEQVCQNGFRVSMMTANKVIKTRQWLEAHPEHRWLLTRLGKESVHLIANADPTEETLQKIVEVASLGNKVSLSKVRQLLAPPDTDWRQGLSEEKIFEIESATRDINNIFRRMILEWADEFISLRRIIPDDEISTLCSIEPSLIQKIIDFDGSNKGIRKIGDEFSDWLFTLIKSSEC
jgi:hypothetical protein